MKDNEFCIGCDCTNINIDLCKSCASYQNARYKEANSFAEKTAFVNLILIWTCLALIAAGIAVLV